MFVEKLLKSKLRRKFIFQVIEKNRRELRRRVFTQSSQQCLQKFELATITHALADNQVH